MMRKRWIGAVVIAAMLTPVASSANLRDRIRAHRERQKVATPADVGFPAKGNPALASVRKLNFGGISRTYRILRPEGAGPFPLVVLLHGGTQNGEKVWAQTSLPTIAARERFVLVAPDGMNGQWNDGRSSTMSGVSSEADDVGFLRALIAEVVAKDGADPRATFMTGASNGGLMTMRYACDAGETLRAGASVIAAMPVALAKRCRPAKPLPWLTAAGTADPLMPFGGQPEGTIRRGSPQPALLSAPATFAFWALNAGCAERDVARQLPNVDTTDGSTAEVHIKSTCSDGATSSFYVFDGAGHSWPAASTGRLATLLGKANDDVDAGTIIWAHFAQALRR